MILKPSRYSSISEARSLERTKRIWNVGSPTCTAARSACTGAPLGHRPLHVKSHGQLALTCARGQIATVRAHSGWLSERVAQRAASRRLGGKGG